MLIEFGHFALITALVFSLLQVILPTFGIINNNSRFSQLAKPLLWGHFFWISVAFLVLVYAFLVNDFSVKYVANNSNTQLPIIFKIAAVYGAHEGSLLLWALILAVWSFMICLFSKRLPSEIVNHILIVLAIISIGFLLFLLFTSNPFERLQIAPLEGKELNPILQDIGLALHPPMLYIGYVGMAIPFAFVISSLIRGQIDSTWLRWTRPWALMAWAFLTLGIVLGSWWAYNELGWGGWWFWDPVENASFMPWLVATAFVHSLSVSEKRDIFKHWTVLLAITGFSLSLLGTFLVRSGILTSVHSFAVDPVRGKFILIFLAIVIGSSLALYAWRFNLMRSDNKFALFSRETGLVLNNIVLVTAMFSVFLGTLYPILLDVLNLGKISVGTPYFNKVFVIIMLPAVLAMAIAPFLRWKKDNVKRVASFLKIVWFFIFLALIIIFLLIDNIFVLLALSLFIWIILHSIVLLSIRIYKKNVINFAFIGMLIAHIGIAFFILGATVATQYGVEKNIKMQFDETTYINGYKFIFKGVDDFFAENYKGYKGNIEVYFDDRKIADLRPEKRQYASGIPTTEAAIDAAFMRDIYVSLGEDLKDNSWSLRLYYKPLVRWIWLGGLLIALGILLAACDRRYRFRTLE